MTKGKYLAIDYGDRRVGLAVSDFDKSVAFPRDFLENNRALIRQIKQFCQNEQIIKVIVGLPVEMDGTIGGLRGSPRSGERDQRDGEGDT